MALNGSGTAQDPYIFTTPEEFKEAIAINNVYVEAGEENLVFDSGKDNIPSCIFRSRQFDGKGLTIRNMVNSATYPHLVELSCSGGNHVIDIRNTNFTNIMTTYAASSSYWQWVYSNVADNTAYIRNCNFAGILRGPMPFAGECPVVLNSQRYDYLNLYDCTFNINMDNPRQGEQHYLFELNHQYSEMNNCTICLSGVIRDRLAILNGSTMQKCTIMNKPTNPLKIDHTSGSVTMELDARGSYQNYIKLYVEKIGNATPILDLINSSRSAKILVNKTRLGSYTTVNNGGIIMYEDDSEGAENYIYSATNLNAKGFTVGEDVE